MCLLAKISNEEIKSIEYSLNTRPRKRLGWRTPLEVFNENSHKIKKIKNT